VHAWRQRKKVCRRNKKKEEVEKHRVQTQNTEAGCTQALYVPKKKAVCENIKQGS
jgi:hypothetical protein